ncbi:SAM-dependent methyltransferase [Streptomyces sp. NPDC007205]|uniref:O-methyltransferase n=1 Tax=Streptomyces sp. NPDC007205 TaxID=3154316 RepID=UPI0033DDDB21
MSLQGIDAYRDDDTLPALVQRAVGAARRHGFAFSCRPEQGRLLRVLASGARHSIAETGTGCGVGLAWLASGAPEGARLISVERDAERARIAAEVFQGCDHVEVLHGDWRLIERYGPYDLLVLDGGGQAKGDGTADPARLLAAGGTVVITSA